MVDRRAGERAARAARAAMVTLAAALGIASLGCSIELAPAQTEGRPTTPLPGRPSTTNRAPSTSTSSSSGAGATTVPIISPEPGASTTSLPTGPTDPTDPTDPARALIDTLVVAEPAADLPPYRRADFGDGWAYDPASGCNTRERVLIEEAIVAPVVDDRCRSTNGRWRSAYDGLEVTDVAELEIDHLVPLAEAWRSGAASWPPERRASFYDDLTQPETLIAVTGRTNRSKGDRRPDQWLPPDRDAWCRYATDWVAVKARWQLSVTPAEKATLVSVLSGC